MQPSQAAALVRTHYGLDGEATALAGERDLNFRITAHDTRYILKVQRPTERGFIAAQNLLLDHVAGTPQLDEPRVVRTVDGDEIVELRDGRLARLLTWVDGDLWSELPGIAPEMLLSLGQAVARLDAQLGAADMAAVHDAVARPFGWNVLQSRDLLESVDLIADEEVRGLVTAVLHETVTDVVPRLHGMPQQLIHNDANDNNIIARDGAVAALIDFGDVIIAPRVCGLAVAITYSLDGEPDPLHWVTPIVTGYHHVAPLEADELELLFPLIKARIAASITMAAIQHAADPGNDYLLVSQQLFTHLIRELSTTSAELTLCRFRSACGYEPHPASRAVRQHLMGGDATIADVVMPPLRDVPKVWFDWSSSGGDAPKTPGEIETAMVAAGARLAVGNYCEDRDVYKGDAYQVTDESRRTVHLGVDLFAPAGTPVYAALDGEVALFHDNNRYLDYGPVIVLRHVTTGGTPFFTLYGHLSRPSLIGLYEGKPVKAGDQIATMGEEFENVGWAPHVHFQLLVSLVDMGIDVYGVAPLDDLPVWRSISPNPNLILRMSEGTDVHAQLTPAQLRTERSVVMSRALSLNFRDPLTIVRGEGAYLYDERGTGYLDLVNNVAHVGHGNARVVEAGARQMALLNTNTRYLNQNAIEFARSLAGTMPDPLNVVFFVNSGSEANDLALRLAQAHTGARGVMVLEHAYHGHLSSIIDISPYKFQGKGGRGRPDHVRVAPIPDDYKGIHRGPDAGDAYAGEFGAALAELDQPLAAFIAEAIVSTAGQVTLADGFLPQAYAQAREAGGLCIADEVQIGMGRVGRHFWGFELHGVRPDIVTIGKPLGNGHPLAAVVTTPDVAQSFLTGMEYFNTFGGNPVSAAIGQAVLDVIGDSGLQAHAREMGDYLMGAVRAMQGTYECIGDVRGSGLFIGVEFVTADGGPATTVVDDLIQFAKERGVFLSCDGPGNNVLKIKPPMVVSQRDVDLFLSVLSDGLASTLH